MDSNVGFRKAVINKCRSELVARIDGTNLADYLRTIECISQWEHESIKHFKRTAARTNKALDTLVTKDKFWETLEEYCELRHLEKVLELIENGVEHQQKLASPAERLIAFKDYNQDYHDVWAKVLKNRKIRVGFCEHPNADSFAENLYTHNTITKGDWEGLREYETSQGKMIHLLDILPGKDLFWEGVIASLEGNALARQYETEVYTIWEKSDLHTTSSEIMSIELSNRIIALELEAYPEPLKKLTVGLLTIDVEVTDAPTGINLYDKLKVYKNFSDPKGLALIINNRKFSAKSRLTERLGTDVDCENMKNLLSKLGYKVQVEQNLTMNKMADCLMKFSQDSQHRAFDSCIVVILSHGKTGGIYGTDGALLNVESMLGYFAADECPNLAGKPKLFFLQACRGNTDDKGSWIYTDGYDVSHPPIKRRKLSLGELRNLDETDSNELKTRIVKIPTQADFLIAYSTTPGYVSWRHEERGSCFIQTICEVFKSHAKNENVEDLLKLVSTRILEKFEGTGYVQTTEYANRSFNIFFFFPGLNSAPS